jgi:hypothetical protein
MSSANSAPGIPTAKKYRLPGTDLADQRQFDGGDGLQGGDNRSANHERDAGAEENPG